MLPSIIIPTSLPSHQAALIVHVSVKVLLGLGSDVGIIIEGYIQVKGNKKAM